MPDRETIIETRGDGGMGAGMIAAIVIVVVLLVAGEDSVFSRSGNTASATLDLPKVTVTAPKS